MQIFFIITILFFVIAVSISIIIMKITYTSELNLKKISEKISDGYLILNKSFNVTNYNKAFLKYTNLQEKEVKRKNIKNFINKINFKPESIEKIQNSLNNIDNRKDIQFTISQKSKIYKIEIMSIVDNDIFMRYVILIKDVSKNYKAVENLKENLDILANRERFVSFRWINYRYSSFFKISNIFYNRSIRGLYRFSRRI